MVSSINKGYFGAYDSQNFIEEIQKKNNLQTRLKFLSSDEREFVALACDIAELGRDTLTSWFPFSDYGMLEEGKKSSKNILDRFEEIEQKITNAPLVSEKSNIFLRIFKGIGNFFGRISSQSLTSKVEYLKF